METFPILVAELGAADAAEVGPMCKAVVEAVLEPDLQEESDVRAEQAAKSGTRDAKDFGYSCNVVVEILLLHWL